MVENLFLGLVLFFLAVAVFTPAFTAGFIWDDDQLLTQNAQVHSAAGWRTLWTGQDTADYFPLTYTSLWIEYHLGQLFNLWNVEFLQRFAAQDVWNGYHIMNVLFHAITVLLTWQTLKRLRVPGAWVAAAIFAVHPVCVESVAWISERKNTLSQIFFLLAIMKYVGFEEKGRLRTYIWGVVFFTLSLLAKTSVVMLPFILLLLAWWRRKEIEPLRASYTLDENPAESGILLSSCVAAGAIVGGALLFYNPWLGLIAAVLGAGAGYAVGQQVRRLRVWNSFAGFEVIRAIPYFEVAFVLGLVTIYFQYGRAIGGEQIPIGNLWQRACSACFAAGFYLYSAFWPFNIIEIYPQWHRAFTEHVTLPKPHIENPAPEAIPYYIQVLPGLALAGLLIVCWLRRTTTWGRSLLVGLGAYLLAMLPALGLLTMSYMRLTLVADHFQYISIVAIIALVVGAGFSGRLNPIYLCIASAFFAVVSYLNWNQTPDNHAAQIFWIAGPLALAAAAAFKEYWKYVWGGFIATVLICFSIITFGQTGIYHSEGTLWGATLDKNPFSWQAHNHLGAWDYMQNDWRDAGPHFLRATQLKPENPESHNNLGLYYSKMYEATKDRKWMDEALEQYQIAVGIKDDSAMDTNLGNAYEQMGQIDDQAGQHAVAVPEYLDAVKTYQHALEITPGNASAHCNMGFALMQLGRVDDAINEFMQTIELDPGMSPARGDLIQALRAKGIDLSAPTISGTYGFDLQRALDLLRATEPRPGPGQ